MYLSDNKNDFLNFPKELYSGDPFYATKSEDISECEKLFVVKEGDRVIARAGAVCKAAKQLGSYAAKNFEGKKIGGLEGRLVNESSLSEFLQSQKSDNSLPSYLPTIHPSNTIQIAFFEAENNLEAVKFLFNEIKRYAKSKGYDYLIGPINGSTWKKYRVTLPSNNPPFLLDNYNKPYYAELFEQCGFETIANYTSSVCRNLDRDYSRLEKFKKIFEQKGVKIRKFNPEKFDEDIRKIYEVSVRSFVNNFLYTPIEFEEFYKMYEPVKSFLNPEWVLIAENEQDEAIAFIFGFDNLYNRSEKSLIIKTLAQIPECKYRGIGSYLTEFMHKKAKDAGYDNIIHALMHESNVSANILSGELYHEYKLYGVNLTPPLS